MDEEDFSSLPLEDKLLHKSWKARQQSYEELTRKFRVADSPKEAIFREFFDSVRKSPTEANVVAQESGISCLLAFLECCEVTMARRMRDEVASVAIEKGLSATKAGTRSKTQEVLMILIEIEQSDPIVSVLLGFFSHKQPKLVAAVINCLSEIVKNFGADVAGYDKILKQLPEAFGHADKSVRSEATGLVVELSRWIPSVVLFSKLSSALKSVQLKELQELCSSQEQSTPPTPHRYLRSQRPVPRIEEETLKSSPSLESMSGDGEGVVEEQIEDVDPTETTPAANSTPSYSMPPVDLNTILPTNLYESLSSASWKDRKEVLDVLLPLIKGPKISEKARYSEVVDALSKRISDANVSVVIAAANCLEALARGLGPHFSLYRVAVTSALLDRCKEKKATVLDALRAALDAIRPSLPAFGEGTLLGEEIAPFMSHKNPSIRAECLLWISRSLQAAKGPTGGPTRKDCRVVVESVLPLMDDGTTEVREAAAECLAVVQRLLGDAVATTLMEKLDKLKMNRVKELAAKLTISPAANSSAATTRTKVVADSQLTASTVKSTKLMSAESAKPQPVPVAVAAAKSSAHPSSAQSRPQIQAPVQTSIVYAHTDEEAERFFVEWLGENCCNEISDANWKVRLSACEGILKKLEESPNLPLGCSTELTVRFFSRRPGWKESNFQVYSKILNCLLRTGRCQFYTQEAASLLLSQSAVIEKLADPKLQRDCSELFLMLAEQVSLSMVLGRVIEAAREQKSPKIQSELLKWLQGALKDFGHSVCPLPGLIDLCKGTLTNSNPTVRGAAVALAGTLRAFIGPDFRLAFNDLPSQTLNVLDAEFSRIASEPVPQPSRANINSSRSLQSSASDASIADSTVSTSSNDAAAAVMEDLIPRVNITPQITDVLLEKLNDVSWKTRKEALDEIGQLLVSANNRIRYTGNGDLFNQLKARFNDSNKNLAIQALDLLGSLAGAMGSTFEKHLRLLLPSTLPILADNKAQVRQAALKALDRFLSVSSSISVFISPSASILVSDNSPNTRSELLTWLSGVLVSNTKIPSSKEELLELISPAVLCLQDRSGDVRKAAQGMITVLLENFLSAESVKRACAEQQPKLLNSLQPFFDAARKSTTGKTSVNAQSLGSTSSAMASSTSDSMPKTPQRAGSVRQANPTTPLKHSASSQSLSGAGAATTTAPSEEFPILTADGGVAKTQRGSTANRWNNFDSIRRDLIDHLKEQMMNNFAPITLTRLFSDDFRNQLGEMSRIEEFLRLASDEGTRAKFLSNSDLLLKYLTLRFLDTNTTVLTKALDVTEALIVLLDNCNHRLSEYEAVCFIPHLINKLGDAKESLRGKVHGICRQICRIYPASKLFTFLIEGGCRSKNSRTRIESSEELAAMLNRNGSSVLQPARHLPLIGAMLAERDGQVRNAALNVLVQANQLLGPAALQRHLANLPAKDLDLLEERLKRVAAGIREEPPLKDEADVDLLDAPLPETMVLDVAETEDVSVASDPSSLSFASLPDFPHPTPCLANIRKSFEPSSLSHPLDQAIDQIQFSTDLVCIHSLQQLEVFLNAGLDDGSQVIDGATACSTADLQGRVNVLAHALIVRLKEACGITFDIPEIAQMKSRLSRYVSNALMLLVARAPLCRELSEETLELVIRESLKALVSDRLGLFEDHEQIERALNFFIVKALENCPPNRSFSALLRILRESFLVTEGNLAASDKFPELVMKCLWKLTKQLSATHLKIPGRLHVGSLLMEIQGFLTVLPPLEWKMRSSEKLPYEDLPLRTVKTILHELVQNLGLTLLPSLTESFSDGTWQDSFVFSYLKAMLQARGHAEGEIMKLAQGPIIQLEQVTREECLDQTLSEQSHHMEIDQVGHEPVTDDLNHWSPKRIEAFLREVCSQICSKPDTRRGLQQLYEFKCAHPYAQEQLNSFLAGLGDFFFKYITRSLDRLELEESQATAFGQLSVNSTDTGNTSFIASGSSSSVDIYKQKLVQLRRQIFGVSEVNTSGSPVNNSSENCSSASPTTLRRANSQLESPKTRPITHANDGPNTPTKLSIAMDLSGITNAANTASAPASPSSILSLKERLARLRGENQLQKQ